MRRQNCLERCPYWPSIVVLVLLATGDVAAQPALRSAHSKQTPPKESTQQSQAASSKLVASRVSPKAPADSLDGPPFVTAKTWAIADGQTGAILWGHDEAKIVDIASTTKIMTA
jgi:D-alanyl-D-alanine carboxypeptidase